MSSKLSSRLEYWNNGMMEYWVIKKIVGFLIDEIRFF